MGLENPWSGLSGRELAMMYEREAAKDRVEKKRKALELETEGADGHEREGSEGQP